MSNRTEAAEEYKTTLAELTNNNKTQINLLTILAEDYAEFADEIVKVVHSQIHEVPPSQKLSVMYVADSIVKNVEQKMKYRELFAKYIVQCFVHIFDSGDERTRLALYKLRQTWSDVFPRSKLYALDIKINQIDPAWPVISPQSGSSANSSEPKPPPVAAPSPSQIHVNPKFLAPSQPKSEDEERLKQLELQKKELNKDVEEKKYKIEKQKTNKSQKSLNSEPTPMEIDVSVTTNTEEPTTTDEIPLVNGKMSEKGKRREEKKKKKSSRRGKDDDRSRHETETDRGNASEIHHTGKKSRRHREHPSKENSPRQREDQNVKESSDESNTKSGSTKKRFHGSQSDENNSGKIAVEVPATKRIRNEGKDRSKSRTPPTNNSDSESGRQQDWRPRNASRLPQRTEQHSGKTSLINPPTATPGQHAFINSPQGIVAGSNSQQNLSNRFSGAAGLLPTPVNNYSFSGGPPIIRTNEQPRLDGIPANNRIFVDGKAYEVSYIDDIPVIERNSVPHRIYFTGPPRNVIIDGVAHSLAFGDRKTITIDGQPHIIRFGAPSRELYMGDYPFRGAFGGPPIFATINSVRHEIRLGGPPPEVKIEPDPCYELQRLMPNRQLQPNRPVFDYGSIIGPQQPVRGQSFGPQQLHIFQPDGNFSSNSHPSQSSQLDVSGLLQRLVSRGILNTSGEMTSQGDSRKSPARPATPPIPSQHHLAENEAFERRPQPPATLKDFSMRALKIRYQSVIDSIYQAQQRCPNCGLRFDDLNSNKYQRHLDWHFNENFRAQDSSRGTSRNWFLVVEDWIMHSEQGETLVIARSDVFEDGCSNDPKLSLSQMFSSTCSSDLVKDPNCAVCREKFEEFYDEDEDIWKMRDCSLFDDGKAYHPACFQDMGAISTQNDLQDVTSEEAADMFNSKEIKSELISDCSADKPASLPYDRQIKIESDIAKCDLLSLENCASPGSR